MGFLNFDSLYIRCSFKQNAANEMLIIVKMLWWS